MTHTDHQDRETVVVSNGGGAGWFLATILAVVVVVAGFWFFTNGNSGSETVSVELEVPEALTPSE